MRRYKLTVAVMMAVLVASSLQGCVGSSGRRWCNSSSYGCLALKAQQSKTGNIAGQHARCCS